jgi:predicted hotdog family 3-hydroxylacyl-ACP dehydratase
MTPAIDIASLIPHAGRMCLLESVLDWDDAHIRLATSTHRAIENPLRNAGRLRAVHLCEYGAQAMAVHGGLTARESGRPARGGLLVSLRAVRLNCGFVEQLPGELIVTADRLHDGGSSWQYRFAVTHEGTLLADGRAAVMVPVLAC